MSAHKRYHNHLMKHTTRSKHSWYIRHKCELCKSELFKRTQTHVIDGQIYIDSPHQINKEPIGILSTWTQEKGRRMSLRNKSTGGIEFNKRFNEALSYVIVVESMNNNYARINEIENSPDLSAAQKEEMCKELRVKENKLNKSESKIKVKLESMNSIPSVSNETGALNENTIWSENTNEESKKRDIQIRKHIKEKRKARKREKARKRKAEQEQKSSKIPKLDSIINPYTDPF